jgi:hypothetical protein
MRAWPPERGPSLARFRRTLAIGSSTWTASIFPGKGGYVMPVKRPVRVAEALDVGDTATVTVELIDFARKDGTALELRGPG